MKTTNSRKSRSKPCCICRKRFTPNPRLGDRQKTCGSRDCKAERKRRVQAKWSHDNADYWTERRLREQAARLEAGEGKPANTPPPSALKQLPATYIQDELGAHALVILMFLTRLQHRVAQVSIRGQPPDFESKPGKDARHAAQVAIRAEPHDTQSKSGEVRRLPTQVAIAAVEDPA